MKDVMIDIETMSPKDYASIIAIGAVEFDITTGEVGQEFYTNINWKSNESTGRDFNVDTMQWWMKQSDAARMALFEEPTVSLKGALVNLMMFIKQATGATNMWSHASFDERILRHAYEQFGIEVPWHYRNIRDIRTLIGLLPQGTAVMSGRTGTHHNALDDAKFQVAYCHKAYTMLGGDIDGKV